MPNTTPVKDADGTWEVKTFPSGAESRALTEPSQEYLDRRAQEQADAAAAREADAQARVDEYNAFAAELEALEDAINNRAVQVAVGRIFDEELKRKAREVRLQEAVEELAPDEEDTT